MCGLFFLIFLIVLPAKLWIECVGSVVFSVIDCSSPKMNLNVGVALRREQTQNRALIN